MQNDLFVIDKDNCPKTYDTIIYQGMCSNCEHYTGFQLYNGQRCIKCSYYKKEEKQNTK